MAEKFCSNTVVIAATNNAVPIGLHFFTSFTFTFIALLTFMAIPDDGFSQVGPPNYSFTLDQLAPFFPGKALTRIQGQFGKGKIMEKREDTSIIRFEISHNRYRFPVMAQIHNNLVTDFFAPLPTYFLHDIFHQSLINRYGKQNRYVLEQEHAFYEWKNRQGLNHAYAGACVITCFPIYYAVSLATPPLGLHRYRTILQTIQIQEDI